VAEGVVDEVVYYGDMTYYDVRLPGIDEPLTISMKNLIGRPVLDVGTPTSCLGREVAGRPEPVGRPRPDSRLVAAPARLAATEPASCASK
jgi:hypothetical protein